ncbi:MAG: hypothetical protein QOE26_176 [Verrucomicrobiota bacterium]
MRRLRPFIWWLAFSVFWFLTLLGLTSGRMRWLCICGAVVLGFLTDCLVDVLSVRQHQRRQREEYLRQHPGEEPQ